MTGRSWAWLNRVEGRFITRSHELPRRPPSLLVTLLTAAGRGGGLWFAWCAREALRRGGDRRLARGAAASVGAALVLSQAVKRAVPPRTRPEQPGGPARRDLPENPRSSSFPSAHAATSAAFATAVLIHDRRRAVLVLAPVVVYGRVRARVHWPSDVAAGLALGAVTALLAAP